MREGVCFSENHDLLTLNLQHVRVSYYKLVERKQLLTTRAKYTRQQRANNKRMRP